MVDNNAMSTSEHENNGFENEEDECRREKDKIAPEVSTTVRALFDTAQNFRTIIPPIDIRVDIEDLMKTENLLRKDGRNTVI